MLVRAVGLADVFYEWESVGRCIYKHEYYARLLHRDVLLEHLVRDDAWSVDVQMRVVRIVLRM